MFLGGTRRAISTPMVTSKRVSGSPKSRLLPEEA